jgi:8-oxo-dGTP pyrophosphatase MutT (NUDIX family)/phosphohistidine phosphatase SixA
MAPTSPPDAAGPDVVAAGAVVTRKGANGREVLLVHRPKYDDWSFPKGKQDPGEHITSTAVREVLEETGVEIRLGVPLRPQLYIVSGGRSKTVHYWVGHVVGDDDVSTYQANDEVDDLGWFSPTAAAERVTYLDDIDLLEQFRRRRKTTSALLVLRHAKAQKRGTWDGPDPLRPLNEVGEAQAQALVPLLHAFGVSRVLTSSSTRCVQTVLPYAREQVLPVHEVDELSEEEFHESTAAAFLAHLMTTPEPSVLCSHRPVLPRLFEILGISEEPLAPAESVVCHHRKGRLVATERHSVGPEAP